MIKKVYEVKPLRCPECGEQIPQSGICVIDTRQGHVVEKIVRHCGLWQDAANRPPPVENRAVERERGYDDDYFERLCI